MFEKPPQNLGERLEVKEKPIEKLQGFIKDISFELKKEGIPVAENGRISPGQFRDVYPERIIKADKEWIEDLKGRWERTAVAKSQWSWIMSKDQILKQKTMGDTWEMLATAILHKNLGKDFIVVRTSEYDDTRNNVDNIILDRKTGGVVCAFDDVADASRDVFKQKKGDVAKRNWERGGADVYYGISFVERQNRKELKKGEIKHVPLFYFACSEEDIKTALKTFSGESASPAEQKIFESFIGSFEEQIKELRKGPLHHKLEQRLNSFEGILNKLKDVIE